MMRRLVFVFGCAAATSAIPCSASTAQSGVLAGIIYDQTNKAGLGGAEVRIKGTDLVAITDKDGRFAIAGVPLGRQEIEAVRAGYRPFRLPWMTIGAETTHVKLALAVVPEEGAVEDPVSLRLTELSARLAVLAGDTSMASGTEEVRAGTIRVRGTTMTSLGEISANAPLYMIDGIMLAPGTRVSELDPKTIESIEVIKGAAAESLYGSRGANGIIKITTRRPPP